MPQEELEELEEDLEPAPPGDDAGDEEDDEEAADRRRPPLKRMIRRAKRRGRRRVRDALVRHAQAPPRDGGAVPPDGKVTILLVSAWGMGGTIRAALNMAGYLAQTHEVEIISWYRRREEPFFGAFPPGVKVTPLDDQRPGHAPRGLQGLLRKVLRKRGSVLAHPSDRLYSECSLWTDLQLVRKLRGGSGFLYGTRPALNLMLGELKPPGYVLIGLEQMHLHHHAKKLRKAMKRWYPNLDTLVALTEQDVASYDELLSGGVRLDRIPNTVRELGGRPADPDRKVVLAAGRLRAQKGFDYLVEAWGKVAHDFPDWHLRICGSGRLRDRLLAMIDEAGIASQVTLEGPAEDMGGTMAEASIFAMSSRFEGFPLILLEAMSKGMAVVSFDCPTGPADMIDDRVNGILVRPNRDPDAFAEGLRAMMADADLRRRCAAAAPATAHAYTMDAIGPQWEALLGELAAARSSR